MNKMAAWYQKKISSYDKEEWETMVEQLLMRGIYRRRTVDLTTVRRSYLIDVDLVRGSSFPKTKPTLGMRRVVWYALVRLIFFPMLFKWWVQQTTRTCAKFLLSLWLMQLVNTFLYFLSPCGSDVDPNCWLVPLGLMLVLSVVHSQIVSTTEMELARVRPRASYRRKLPRYFRQFRSECDGVGSAESGATTHCKVPPAKPAKFKRRQPRSENIENGLRKRKKELTKENVIKSLEAPMNKPLINIKAKDSDDEDYVAWKNPENPPIVTSSPPPDDATPSSSLGYKSNILTKKHLDSFNVRQSQHIIIARAIFADGDDGFESLNGNDNNSNASDNENKVKTECNEQQNGVPNDDESKTVKVSEVIPLTEESNVADDVKTDELKGNFKKDDEKSDQDSKAIPMNSPNSGKRVGFRFRGIWAEDNTLHESGDEIFENIKKKKNVENYHTSSSDGERSASAPSIALPSHHTMSDWVGHTSNSEGSSYCSQSEGGNSDVGFHYTTDSFWDPFTILNPKSDTVKCTMWECGSTLRAELSAVDISWYVVARAERAMATDGGLWTVIVMATAVALFTPFLRLLQVSIEQDSRTEDELQALSTVNYAASAVSNYTQGSVKSFIGGAYGDNVWEILTNVTSCLLRFGLSGIVFFLLAVAERAYKQRFLYAKLFSHLTSARRARKSELPHFRLNTVRNIKTWLSTRSYLRRRGPQRSVDVIVSSAFMLTITLLACVSAQLLRDSLTLQRLWLLEAMVWTLCLGIYLLRLLALGSDVYRKYRGCLSAIITEQINLHLAIEQRPECKEQLMVANNVLKLAADLLKELDAPFKINGFWTNHYVYTIAKVVIMSALSGVLSDMLGFKLKLHKIKIK